MTTAKSLPPSLQGTKPIPATAVVAIFALLQPFLPASAGQASPQQPTSLPAQKAAYVPPLYPVRLDGKYGYMDRTGKIVVAPQFSRGWDFHDGMAQVDSAEGHGIIDAAGKTTFLRQFSWIGDFSEGLAQVTVRDGSTKAGYIDAPVVAQEQEFGFFRGLGLGSRR